MLKKIFKFLLVLTILVFSFNSRSIDVSALTDGNYEYELINNNKEVRITKYKGKEEYVYLPNTIKGKKVRELGGNSFRNNDKINPPRTPPANAAAKFVNEPLILPPLTAEAT